MWGIFLNGQKGSEEIHRRRNWDSQWNIKTNKWKYNIYTKSEDYGQRLIRDKVDSLKYTLKNNKNKWQLKEGSGGR